MALSVAQLQAQLDALITARSAGVLEVEDSSGERVRYSGLDAMARAIASLESRIASLLSGPINQIRFLPTKGT